MSLNRQSMRRSSGERSEKPWNRSKPHHQLRRGMFRLRRRDWAREEVQHIAIMQHRARDRTRPCIVGDRVRNLLKERISGRHCREAFRVSCPWRRLSIRRMWRRHHKKDWDRSLSRSTGLELWTQWSTFYRWKIDRIRFRGPCKTSWSPRPPCYRLCPPPIGSRLPTRLKRRNDETRPTRSSRQ